MTKDELFKKYKINESHSEWDFRIDNWISIEVFRIMNEGRLPDTEKDVDFSYITKFLDDCFDKKKMNDLMKRDDFGSLYLTAKRMVYRYHEQILVTNK